MTILLLALLAAPSELVAENGVARRIEARSGAVFGMQWNRPIVRTGMFRSVVTSFGAPAISKQHRLVIVGSAEGKVHAYGLGDGVAVWSYAHGYPFDASAVVVDAGVGKQTDELVILGARDGSLLALEVVSGKLRWKVALEGDPGPPARHLGPHLLVTTTANKVLLLSLATGETVWSAGRSTPSGLTIQGHARALAHQGVVYAAFSDGYVEAYDQKDGGELWSRPLSIGGGDFVDADTDPVIAGGRLYVASYSDGIFALNPKDGQTVWHQVAPSVTSLAAEASLVVAASADGFVWGLEGEDGRMAYRTRIPAGPVSRLLLRNRVVVMTAGDSGLVVLDAQSGKPLQATPVPGGFAGDPAWVGRHVALLSGSGFLYTLAAGES